MSSRFETIADPEATADEAGALGERVGVWLVAEGIAAPDPTVDDDKTWYRPGPRWSHVAEERRHLGTDGLAVVTGRTVFFGSPSTGGSPICPHCTTHVSAPPSSPNRPRSSVTAPACSRAGSDRDRSGNLPGGGRV
ncbi:hypothetical protein [Streptomyces sp. NPDC056194]|uniref:hypothetical protein n=1 Tax=unclassified Streptomyces TaxID=2593676 RepID=UPI0035D97C69